MNFASVSKLACVSLCVMVFSSGCASFQGNKLGPVASFPQIQNKKTVDVDFSFAASLNGNPLTMGIEPGRQRLEKICIKRLNASGLFSSVSGKAENTDLKVVVKVEDVGKANLVMAMLTGLTLYVIPSKAQDVYHLTATVTDTKNNRKADIVLEDSITQWQEILLLPMLPFKSTIAEASKCQNKLFDNLALEIQKSGLLN